MVSIAERLFNGGFAQSELETMLESVNFESLGWDHYDCSIELHGVPADDRLSEEAQRIIYEAGFIKAYVNHTDQWETHYSFSRPGEFVPAKGWRVSYRNKHGGKDIWVEEDIPDWPRDWFKSGYVKIKSEPPKDTP